MKANRLSAMLALGILTSGCEHQEVTPYNDVLTQSGIAALQKANAKVDAVALGQSATNSSSTSKEYQPLILEITAITQQQK